MKISVKNISKKSVVLMASVLTMVLVFVAVSFSGMLQTKAAGVTRTYSGSEKIYVNMANCGNSWWNNSGCYHRVYFFGSNTGWASFTATSTSGVYEATVPAGTYTNLILCRCSTSSTTWSSGTVYNQTGDIPLDSSSNYISYFGGASSTAVTWGTFGSTTSSPTATVTATTTTSTPTPTVATPTPTTTTTSTATSDTLQDTVEDGTVLHAFNWSYNTIKSNLANIAAAGFTTVQTSPVQQPKDYGSSFTDVSGQWWKLYQPISFSVAASSWTGTSSELAALCTEADKYGIKIVCDIVVNHLGGNTGATDLNPGIATYESTIYNNYSTYFHTYYDCNDGSIVNVVYGNIGMPDLNTGNSYVQGRVISLLEQCVDCGVDGFRFDAAKHIETSSDGSYASNFWSNVLGTTRSYATNKNVNLFVYGEILNTVGTGRSISAYTSMMRVTDNKAGDSTLYGVYSANASQAASSYYNTGQAASKLVLWAESHDTYMGSSGTAGLSNTSGVSVSNINKAWAMVASRADAVPLYLARPGSTMGSRGTSYYTNTEVAKVNFFHNKFDGAYEYLSNSGSIAMNERYTTSRGTGGGAVLVNVSGTSTTVSMPTYAIGNGTYTDKITGNTFTVSNNTITGTIGSTGIAVIY